MGFKESTNLAPSIVWFRQDLRLQNNPALHKALETGWPIIPVYIWNPREKPGEKARKAGQWWLHHSLANLENKFQTWKPDYFEIRRS